jgi:threonine dehydratase
MPINQNAIKAARSVVEQFVTPTPVLRSIYLSERFHANIVLKLENLNISGSFKIRGATNALSKIPRERLKNGVVAASAGNHAQAVAYVCKRLGAESHIFMPEATPLVKVESTRAHGADITLVGENLEAAYAAAEAFCKSRNAVMIHPYADEDVICGQGTIGLELLEQVPDLSMVVVPIGGGGLISGIACAVKAAKPDVVVVGVQSSASPGMLKSWKAGQIVHIDRKQTIADGIAVKAVNPLNFSLVTKYVDDIFETSENEISSAVMDLIERNHLLAEGAGAAGVSCIGKICEKFRAAANRGTVVCVIGGGNIDINLMRRITMKGLIHSGRILHLRVKVTDRPGGLAGLLSVIAQMRASIVEVHHDRMFDSSHFSDVEVDLTLETTNIEHQRNVIDAISKGGYECLPLGHN